MSHVATIELQIKDLQALEDACKALGLELVRNQQTYKWYGRILSDGRPAYPEGFTEEDLGHCEHAIRIPNNATSYEIGVVHCRDGKPGYTLLWDSFNSTLRDKVGGNNADKLKQEYSASVATRYYKQMGYRVQRSSAKGDGRIVLKATK